MLQGGNIIAIKIESQGIDRRLDEYLISKDGNLSNNRQ